MESITSLSSDLSISNFESTQTSNKSSNNQLWKADTVISVISKVAIPIITGVGAVTLAFLGSAAFAASGLTAISIALTVGSLALALFSVISFCQSIQSIFEKDLITPKTKEKETEEQKSSSSKTQKTSSTKKKDWNDITIDMVDRIHLPGACKESSPCQHDTLTIYLKDGRQARADLTSWDIASLLQALKDQGKEHVGWDHFKDYLTTERIQIHGYTTRTADAILKDVHATSKFK